MGILDTPTPLLVPADIVAFSEFPEVRNKTAVKMQAYIDRAEGLLDRLYSYDNTVVGYATQMQLATMLLVENLIVLQTPTYRRSQLAGFRAETIGTYSYSRSDRKNLLNPAITDEIIGLVQPFVVQGAGGSVPRQSRTEVFVPRTAKTVVQSDIKYFIPEDEFTSESAVRDPLDPRVNNNDNMPR